MEVSVNVKKASKKLTFELLGYTPLHLAAINKSQKVGVKDFTAPF